MSFRTGMSTIMEFICYGSACAMDQGRYLQSMHSPELTSKRNLGFVCTHACHMVAC